MEICHIVSARRLEGDWFRRRWKRREAYHLADHMRRIQAQKHCSLRIMGDVFHNLAQQYPRGENTGIRMRKRVENDGWREREGGTEQISCIQISRVAMRPRALLFLALRAGTGSRTNTIRKQASKPATLLPPPGAKLLSGQAYRWQEQK